MGEQRAATRYQDAGVQFELERSRHVLGFVSVEPGDITDQFGKVDGFTSRQLATRLKPGDRQQRIERAHQFVGIANCLRQRLPIGSSVARFVKYDLSTCF